MKLNLGSGDHPVPGWVNIDAFGGARADMFADLRHLPFRDDSMSHIYAGHVLEHIPPDDLPAVLAEVRRVLAPSGRFCVVGPDCDRIDPQKEPDLYLAASSAVDGGEGVNPFAYHLWDCTETRMLAHIGRVFPSAQAVPVADVPEEWPVLVRSAAWQCAVIA